MNGAELLVSALENEGVQQIFGIPGEETLGLVEALRRSTIELVLTRHEQAAAFMAATHGRLTGRAGVCLSTLGPGALNLTTGAAFALLGAATLFADVLANLVRASAQSSRVMAISATATGFLILGAMIWLSVKREETLALYRRLVRAMDDWE